VKKASFNRVIIQPDFDPSTKASEATGQVFYETLPDQLFEEKTKRVCMATSNTMAAAIVRQVFHVR